jgi:hypothetical protein
MSELTQTFVVQPNNINITVDNNSINFTPADIQLNIYGGSSLSVPGGNLGELQYNNGVLDGIPNVTYSGGNLNLGQSSNIKILGGSNNYFLKTDGTGNLTWASSALAPGGVNTSIQFNNSNTFDGSSNLTFNSTTNTLNSSFYSGNGYYLTNINGASVTGTVANATYAITAGTAGIATTATYANAAGNINAATFAIENVDLIGAQSGVYNFYFLTDVIKYSTANAAANLIVNFTGNGITTANSLLSNGQSITATYVMTTGAALYYITEVRVDGVAKTVKYAAGATPLPVAGSKNSYTFTIIKTSTTPTYDVLGTFTRYS